MIYLSIFLVLILFALVYDFLNVREGRVVSYWCAYVVLVCLAGFRYKVGGDTYNYMRMYDLLPDLYGLFETDITIEKLQPLWVLFSAVAKTVGEDFYIFQLIHAVVVNAVVFYFIKNNTRFRHTGVLFYYFSLYPVFNFEILRESLAISCFLISIKFYENKSWARYYLISTVAVLFHFSAVFLYLLPAIRYIKFNPLALVSLFAISALLNPVMIAILNSIVVQQFIGFAFREYIDYRYTIFGLASIFIFYFSVPLVLTWMAQHKLETRLQFKLAAEKGLIISACIPLFFIFYRFFNYFSLLYLLIACEVFHAVIRSKSLESVRGLTIPALFSALFIFYTARYFQDTSHLADSTRWYNWWYPYHSIFDPVEFLPREEMIENQNRGSYER